MVSFSASKKVTRTAASVVTWLRFLTIPCRHLFSGSGRPHVVPASLDFLSIRRRGPEHSHFVALDRVEAILRRDNTDAPASVGAKVNFLLPYRVQNIPLIVQEAGFEQRGGNALARLIAQRQLDGGRMTGLVDRIHAHVRQAVAQDRHLVVADRFRLRGRWDLLVLEQAAPWADPARLAPVRLTKPSTPWGEFEARASARKGAADPRK